MIANTFKTLIVVVAWIAFMWRAYAAFRGRHSSDSKPIVVALWLVWVPSFFLLLAGLTFNEVYLDFISTHVGEWFIYAPRVAFGIIGFIIGSYACIRLRLLPESLLPRWREWTIWAGVLAVADFTLLRWIGWHLFPDQPQSFNQIADVVFRTYLLIATVQIGLPTLHWCRSQEPGIIFRMRLNFLWWFNFMFAIWMIVDILSLGNGFPLLTTPLALAFWSCFLLGLFTPDRIYQHRLIYFYHLDTFFLVRFLELLAYFEIDKHIAKHDTTIFWTLPRVDWHEVIKQPEYAAYKSIISLLDISKMLCTQAEGTLAWRLGQSISLVRTEHSGHLEVMNHLRKIAFEYLASIPALGTLLNRGLQLRRNEQAAADLLI